MRMSIGIYLALPMSDLRSISLAGLWITRQVMDVR